MLKTFWEEQKVLINFFGFIATLAAIFLNIALPDDKNAKFALANIQVFWLLVLTIALAVLFFRFIKLVFRIEKEMEIKHDIFTKGAFSSLVFIVFLWIVSNFGIYIMNLYQESFTMLLFMTLPLIMIALVTIIEYHVHKNIKKFSLFSEFMIESFGMAIVFTSTIIWAKIYFFNGIYIERIVLIGIIMFFVIFGLALANSSIRRRKIFTSRVFQDMTHKQKLN